jgi:hypothetical protein
MGPTDMGFLRYPSLTLPTILLHWSLTISSFMFKIPARRIKTGDRIWPEYRLHALVFLSRSLMLCSVYYYEQYYKLPPNYNFNFAIAMLTLLMADVSSWSVEHPSGTIRGLDIHPFVQFFFSLMQFGAHAACFYGIRRYSVWFYLAMIVQVSPFLMTLRRKNLVSKAFGVTMYGIGLVYAIGLVLYEYSFHAPYGLNSFLCQDLITIVATWLRLGPRLPLLRYVQDNKYVMWFLLGLLLRYIRPWFDTEEPLSPNLNVVCHVARVSMFGLAIWKGFLRDRYNQKSPSTNGNADSSKKEN